MNVSLGKLTGWVKDQVRHGDYHSDSEVIREAVRRMKDSQGVEPDSLQKAMDQAEDSGFERMTERDWRSFRRLAKAGMAK